MKKILPLAVALAWFAAPSAFCDQKIDANSWHNLGKFNPSTLAKTLGDHVGQLVAVQFNFRGKDIRHIKPNWYEGSVWLPDRAEKKGFSNVRVLFAKKDVAAFQAITQNSASRTPLILYGRVERDADSHFFFLHVWGSKVAFDAAGNATVTW